MVMEYAVSMVNTVVILMVMESVHLINRNKRKALVKFRHDDDEVGDRFNGMIFAMLLL